MRSVLGSFRSQDVTITREESFASVWNVVIDHAHLDATFVPKIFKLKVLNTSRPRFTCLTGVRLSQMYQKFGLRLAKVLIKNLKGLLIVMHAQRGGFYILHAYGANIRLGNLADFVSTAQAVPGL